MKPSTIILLTIGITSIILLACSLLPIPGTATETPPTITPAAALPPTEQSVETGTALDNENLLVAVPKGFKIDFQAEQNKVVINEMVPQSESVNDWTTLVTVQIFLGLTNTTPEQYQDSLTQLWFNACQSSESYPVTDGVENGYNFVLWQLYCPLNPSTQKVEFTYLKAIQGNDSFYLVQVAVRHEPSSDEITQWMNYLRTVQVCDSRIPERACS
jgi:hypothetical protein